MASNGLTSDPDEYLNTFPEVGSQRLKQRNNNSEEDDILEEIDEVTMCNYLLYYIIKL